MAVNQSPRPGAPIMEFVHRFQALEAHRDTGNELVKDLLTYCANLETSLTQENARLAEELNVAQLDLEDAKKSRRNLQWEISNTNSRIGKIEADCESMRNRNPYIIVLVDGDGMIFNENLIAQGLEGGKQAATLLRNAVLSQCSEITNDFEIIAKVCANVSGLSKAMLRDGSLSNVEIFREFTLGFTQGRASFDFIDVGHGKERADSKIRENMRWHLRNYNCKQILLGISHDAGYAPFLDEVVGRDDKCRITIMEGVPTVRELTSTNVQIINFNAIFRADKLVDRSPVTTTAPPSTWAGVTSIAPPPASTSPVPVHQNNGSPLTINTKKKATPAPKISWTPEPRGLDPPQTYTHSALDRIKRRTGNDKLCNNHYLRGPCAKGNDCCFEHDYPATDEDLEVIAFLTRLNPCTSGQDCENEYCIYGHHCPSVVVVKGMPVCEAFGCRFGVGDHPPGTVVKRPRKERWEGSYERY